MAQHTSVTEIQHARQVLNARIRHLDTEYKMIHDIKKKAELKETIQSLLNQDAILEEEAFQISLNMVTAILKKSEKMSKRKPTIIAKA